jgi:2-polyprenyl-6-methoxyphenol hydroxylase-like FAD-dependent oxidoreductase
MFRGAAGGDFLDGRTMVIVKDPDGVDLVTYPIGGGLLNWVVMLPEADAGLLPGDAKWNQPGDRSRVLEHLERWNLGFLDAADLVRRTEPVLEYPMVDRDVLPWWGSRYGAGRVTLLGDAAHPMYPVGANGGSQAIVDARVLADELARDFAGGLRSYEDIRRPETADVVAANREMHVAGATQRPEDLAKVTGKYREDTQADKVER